MAIALKPLGIPCAVYPAALKHLTEVFHLRCVDQAGPCALVPRRLGKISNDRHTLIRVQRKDVSAVFQQHHTFGRRFAGQVMVRLPVDGFGRFLQGAGCALDQIQQLLQTGVDVHF